MSDTIKTLLDAARGLADIIAGIPSSTWGPVITLCSFGLAAFAIYAVLSVTRRKQ